MTNRQILAIGLILFASALIVELGLSKIATSVNNLKPTMAITQNPVTIKVIDGPRPTGLLPGVEAKPKPESKEN
jgi:hypothetical protein